jgi:precorrin-6Y C5,15-methyltransferase (decarboxylating)
MDNVKKKDITIAGIGLGNPETATLQVLNAIDAADVLIGAARMIEQFADKGKRMIDEYRAEKIAEIIKNEPAERFAVLVSGDPGLYSGAQSIAEALAEYDPRVMPGVSSVSYLCSAVGHAWNDAEVISAHGRHVNIASEVRRNKKTFVLTDGNMPQLLETLCEYGFGKLPVYIGERLSYSDEKITEGMPETLAGGKYDKLAVMLVINENADARILAGIDDERFERGNVPMTKREVRAVTMSALKIQPDSIVYDIGAGTGSVSIECAMAAYRGTVYGIEVNPEAVRLMEKNAHTMAVDNITAVTGNAPEAMADLPAPDFVFVGGSNGQLESIVDALVEKNRNAHRDFRLVINAVSMETIAKSVTMLSTKKALKIEYTQISASRTRSVGEHNLLQAQNPVFIIKAEFRFA